MKKTLLYLNIVIITGIIIFCFTLGFAQWDVENWDAMHWNQTATTTTTISTYEWATKVKDFFMKFGLGFSLEPHQ